MIPVIESCILENVAMRLIFFFALTHLLRYWSNNRDNKEFPAYSKLINIFWDEVCELFNKLIDNSIQTCGAIKIVVNSMSELLLYLKTAPDHSQRNMKVKFSDSVESTNFPPVSAIKISDVNENDQDIFCNELQQIVVIRNWCKHPDITNKLIQEAQDFLCSLEFCESDEKMFIHAFEVADTGGIFH